MRRERVAAMILLTIGIGVALVAACSPPPPASTDFDIKLVANTTQTVAFGHNILPGEKDSVFVDADLGLTPFISLDPQLFFKSTGISAHFKSPFAATQIVAGLDVNNCPTTPASDGCHFVSDAELELFTRSPTELYTSLINDPHKGLSFIEDISTPRLLPTGEAAPLLNPPPFNLPDVVVMDVTDPPRDEIVCGTKFCTTLHLNQPTLNPVISTSFWLNDNTTNANLLNGPAVPQTLWGSPANQPSGRGSVKGARLVQHAPCEFEVTLQDKLETVKEQLVAQGLSLCGTSPFVSVTVTQADVHTFDAVTFIRRVPSAAGLATFETTFGLLIHGDLTLGGTGAIATAPCDVDFLYEYQAGIKDGKVTITPVQRYMDFAGGGQGGVGDPRNICTYARNALIGDSNGNGLNGNPPILTTGAANQIAGALSAAQSLDTVAISFGLGLTPSQARCHAAGAVGTAASCTQVAAALTSTALLGATQKWVYR